MITFCVLETQIRMRSTFFSLADSFANEDPVGFLTIQVEIFKHPGTGEYKVNVKGKSADALVNIRNAFVRISSVRRYFFLHICVQLNLGYSFDADFVFIASVFCHNLFDRNNNNKSLKCFLNQMRRNYRSSNS